MTESRYIKLDYEDAINAKKQILASELGILNLTKTLNSYKSLRKNEFDNKARLKSAFYVLKSKIATLQSTFPEEEKTKIKVKERQFIIENKEKTTSSKPSNYDFENELAEIQKKLQKLE